MPGRRGYLQTGGSSTGGAGDGSGSGLPVDLGLSERNNNQPAEYKATNSIEFVDGFVSGSSDEFVAYITTDQIGGGGSGSYNWVMDGNAGYRYGYNGKEMDNEFLGQGNEYEYGFRIYNARLGRFLSVDPLLYKYPKYSAYQFAGNKPTVFIDLDGAEEYYDPSQDPYFLKNIWDNAVDGFGNLILKLTIPQTEGILIRKNLIKQGFNVPTDGSIDIRLSQVFDIHKENREFVVTPERNAMEKLAEVGISLIDVAAVFPSKGAPFILAAETSPVTSATIASIIRALRINARTKEIVETFVDLERAEGARLSQFQAESGALLEESHNLTLRSIKNKTESGDYVIASGKINDVSVAGKTIDQIGIPPSAVGKFKMHELTDQIKQHVIKEKADLFLLDIRNLAKEQKVEVLNFLKSDLSKYKDKIITIGVDK